MSATLRAFALLLLCTSAILFTHALATPSEGSDGAAYYYKSEMAKRHADALRRAVSASHAVHAEFADRVVFGSRLALQARFHEGHDHCRVTIEAKSPRDDAEPQAVAGPVTERSSSSFRAVCAPRRRPPPVQASKQESHVRICRKGSSCNGEEKGEHENGGWSILDGFGGMRASRAYVNILND